MFSGLPRGTDIVRPIRLVRFVPRGDIERSLIRQPTQFRYHYTNTEASREGQAGAAGCSRSNVAARAPRQPHALLCLSLRNRWLSSARQSVSSKHKNFAWEGCDRRRQLDRGAPGGGVAGFERPPLPDRAPGRAAALGRLVSTSCAPGSAGCGPASDCSGLTPALDDARRSGP